MKNTLLASTAFALIAAFANAQVANVSTTDLTTAGYSTGLMQTSASPTYISNDGDTLIAIKQAPTAVTATVRTQATQMSQSGYGTVTLNDQVLSIPSGTGVIMAGPFPTGRWNTAQSTIKVDVTAPVSITALRLPQ